MTRVVVVGLGYVGLPLAMRAAEAGHQVIGYDTDPGRVKRLGAGESYIEDVPAAQLLAMLENGAFHPSSESRDCTGFDVALITVPTPLRDGLPDLAHIEAAARVLARYLRPGATVIVESRNTSWTLAKCPEDRLRDRRRVAGGGPGLLPGPRRPDRAGVVATRGRAGQDH
jgi:UDP-N-acetyl-D-glucosamine dehydrogenase